MRVRARTRIRVLAPRTCAWGRAEGKGGGCKAPQPGAARRACSTCTAYMQARRGHTPRPRVRAQLPVRTSFPMWKGFANVYVPTEAEILNRVMAFSLGLVRLRGYARLGLGWVGLG